MRTPTPFADLATALAELRRSRDATCVSFDRACSDPAAAARAYAPGKWTARAVLVHLADGESVSLDRTRRLLADDRPLLWGYDENRWAAGLGYDRRDLAVLRDLYAASRSAILDLVSRAVPGDLARSGVHSEAGTVSLGLQLAKIVAHDDHHRAQVDAALAGKTWPA